ncbi:MAG: outer membrane protein assembly factor, partial [Gammaproteobacteria bacterium]|nr:outer membrane protein assembly factor [Gammaproteobacteria bacterium]
MSGFVFVLLCSFSLIGSYGAYADESPEIEIKGVNDNSEKNIRAFLSLSKEPCDAPQWRVQQLYEKSDQQIDKALRALGYYQPEIHKQLTFKEACWSAQFKISPGLPVIVHTLNVSITGEAQ